MPVLKTTLWSLARGGQPIDANALAAAIEHQAELETADFRTRLLIRDASAALEGYWGTDKFHHWVAGLPSAVRIQEIQRSDLGPAGFPTLSYRIMDATQPQTVLQFLRELGSRIRLPARLDIGGSTSLILAGLLSRHTDDIDVADESPAAIVGEHALLNDLAQRYGLCLAHFQSRYLPPGWARRVRSLERFENLDVFLIDPLDVLLSKLFSPREKDLDDLRAVVQQIDPADLQSRLKHSCGALLAEPRLLANARHNWYVLFGEQLPG